MNSQDFRNLQEAYLNVYEQEEALDEKVLGQDPESRKAGSEERKSGSKRLPPSSGKGYADNQKKSISYMNKLTKNNKIIPGMAHEEVEEFDEGIGSAIKGLFAKKKEPEAQKPESRGAQLRKRYNTGPEKSDTSVKRAIINRSRDNATRAQAQVDRGNASQSYADKANNAVDSYLKAGYNKYGADRSDSGGMGGSGGSGRGNKARKRAAALNNSYDLFDYMMEYLIDEGYADTNENALVIMANMSEEWRESILLDERIRDSPRPDKEEYMKRREIMRQNAKQAEREASTNNLIRSRKPPEPRKPDRVGNPSAATPSGEGLNPENKPPRPRVVTPYVPPSGTENLKDRTSKIAPFGTVKPPFIPPAAPKKIR